MRSDTKLRILILATRVPLRSGDGTPSFVLDGATALSEEFEITILAPRIRGSRPVERHDGVTVRRFAYFPSRWECLADDAIMPQLGSRPALWIQALPIAAMMLLHTMRELRTNRPDVVHAHWILPAGFVALVAKICKGTPYLVTSHGADAFRLHRGPLRTLNRAVINRASRPIGVSTDIVQQFGALSTPVEVQPVAVNGSLWKQIVGPRTPVRGRVLFVGRLAAKKGVADAIRALAPLEEVQLRIIGDGLVENELRDLAAESGKEECVIFLGRRNRDEVAEELRSASCLIIPSVTASDGDRDGTPSVLGEAIAAGVPVIASRLAGLAEFIADGETGLLHDPGDVEGLRACVLALIYSPETAEEFALEAAARFLPYLDEKHVTQRYANWYRDAISAREATGI